MRVLMSYILSHMYDIHAIVAGAVVVAAMMYIKVPVKKKIRVLVDTVIKKNPNIAEKRSLLIRRWNFILIIIVFLLSTVIFATLACISPFIEFAWPSSFMAGVFALCIYAFVEQVSRSSEKRNKQEEKL